MMLRGSALAVMLATVLVTGTALPSFGLEIYEPDSVYNAAPNGTAQTALLFRSAETRAKVVAGGAEMVKTNPQYANAVVNVDKDGKLRADVYVRLQRVISLAGDDGTKANAIPPRSTRRMPPGRSGPTRSCPAAATRTTPSWPAASRSW